MLPLLFVALILYACHAQRNHTLLDSNNYYFYMDVRPGYTFEEANQYCLATFNFSLATVSSAFEETRLVELILHYWGTVHTDGYGMIGLLHNQGNYTWADGVTPYNYSNFASPVPDHNPSWARNSDCIYMMHNQEGWFWIPSPCTDRSWFFCNGNKLPTEEPTAAPITSNPTVTTNNPTSEPSSVPTSHPTTPSSGPTPMPLETTTTTDDMDLETTFGNEHGGSMRRGIIRVIIFCMAVFGWI
eukprot:184823_1